MSRLSSVYAILCVCVSMCVSVCIYECVFVFPRQLVYEPNLWLSSLAANAELKSQKRMQPEEQLKRRDRSKRAKRSKSEAGGRVEACESGAK